MISLFKPKKVLKVIFLHLPKAGGTTLRHIFYDQYKFLKREELYTINRTKETGSFISLSNERRNQIKVLIGHFPFGLHEYMSGDFQYVTFMRDPVDRVISAFFYNKGHKDSDVYNLINDENLNLVQYLEKNIEP